MIGLEVCVDSVEGMYAALEGGADRIELCSALEVGGLTPSAGQMKMAASLPIPVHALIRSRAGGFNFGPHEIETMLGDIRAAREAGLAGVVIGAATPDETLDRDALSAMVAAAGGLSVTLHRVIDLVPDMSQAVEEAITLGFDRILTSGGAVGAYEGATAIASLCNIAAGRIGILPAAGITDASVQALLAIAPVTEVHSACAVEQPLGEKAVALGFGNANRLVTSSAAVRALKSALNPKI